MGTSRIEPVCSASRTVCPVEACGGMALKPVAYAGRVGSNVPSAGVP